MRGYKYGERLPEVNQNEKKEIGKNRGERDIIIFDYRENTDE